MLNSSSKYLIERNTLVSVVIPTWNRSRFLVDAVQSVIQQDYPFFEVIIVDDQSTDDTKYQISKIQDSRIRYFRTQIGKNIGRSRNFGIKQSSGSLIAFLDSDDLWSHNHLSEALSKLEEHDLVYSNLILIDENGCKIGLLKSRTLSEPQFENLLKFGNPIGTSSVVVRREVIEAVGFFSEDSQFMGIEDYELWVRIANRSADFRHLETATVSYRVHSTSISVAPGNPYSILWKHGRKLKFRSFVKASIHATLNWLRACRRFLLDRSNRLHRRGKVRNLTTGI